MAHSFSGEISINIYVYCEAVGSIFVRCLFKLQISQDRGKFIDLIITDIDMSLIGVVPGHRWSFFHVALEEIRFLLMLS